MRSLSRTQPDAGDSASGPVHQPPTRKSMDPSTHRLSAQLRHGLHLGAREAGPEGPPHSNLDLLVVHPQIGSRRQQPNHRGEHAVPTVETDAILLMVVRSSPTSIQNQLREVHPTASMLQNEPPPSPIDTLPAPQRGLHAIRRAAEIRSHQWCRASPRTPSDSGKISG
jgi:hypothetical protein